MDEQDLSSEREQIARESAIITSRKPEGPKRSTGACYHCNCSVGPGQRWCDAICRDDWQADQDKAA